MKLTYVDVVIGVVVGAVLGVGVGGFVGSYTARSHYQDTINITNETWESKIEDCRKMEAFIYNNQLYRCKPTGKWAHNNTFRSFM